MSGRQLLLLTPVLLATHAWAADLTLLAVDSFGRPLEGCRVESFRKANDPSSQYRSRFQGMTGTRIPLGGYRVTVQCGEREAYCEITVQRTNQFEVFATRDRRMISDPVKPQLTIKLDPLPQPNDTWWIRLIGLYRSEIQADRFAPGTGVASISEPEPGRYLVTVLSAKGYVCVRRVDVLEFTKSWIFHSGDCSFEFDRHARLAPDDRGAVSTP